MFKVSLLPESYRKKLIGKKNKDIILSIAVIVLVCMLIIFAGFEVKLLLLKRDAKASEKTIRKMEEKIAELEPYVDDYNNLAIAQANFDNIKPVDITALEMVNIIQGITPDYVQITAIYAPNWQRDQVCVIEGDLSSASGLGTATKQVQAYKEIIEKNPELEGKIREIKIVNDAPIVNEGTAGADSTYSFRIIVSLSGIINIDDQTGTLMTHTTSETTTETTTTEVYTEPEETTVEASTIA